MAQNVQPTRRILEDRTQSHSQYEGELHLNTEATNDRQVARKKGTPPAFSLYLKDKDSKANIPLGSIWENRFPDGNIGYAVGLAQTYARDPKKGEQYQKDKDAFLLQMERFYDGELYLNMSHTAARSGGSRASARNALQEGAPRIGGGEVKDGLITRIVKAIFKLS